MKKEKSKKDDCIFCKIVKGDEKSTKIYEDDNFIGILNVYPIAKDHSLIISKKHFKTLLDMPSSLGNELIDVIKNISLDLIKKGKYEGFNITNNVGKASGQSIDHLHIHIIPRKNDDGLRNIPIA